MSLKWVSLYFMITLSLQMMRSPAHSERPGPLQGFPHLPTRDPSLQLVAKGETGSWALLGEQPVLPGPSDFNLFLLYMGWIYACYKWL